MINLGKTRGDSELASCLKTFLNLRNDRGGIAVRVRDLTWYILSCIVLILSYAAIAVCYYLPVRAKAESSMKVLGYEATQNIEKSA